MERSWYYVVDALPLGAMWLQASERGLCGIGFGEGLPEAELRRLARYGLAAPHLDVVPLLEAVAGQLSDYFAGRRRSFDLPLDLRGTEFQRAVWDTLLAIPYGDTWSYGEVAEAVDRPRAAQAVGQAVGANPIAIVVPCHRVVGHDGALTGYASGLHRKQALLQMEQSGQQLRLA